MEKRFIVKPEEKVVVAIMDAYCDGIQEEVEKKCTRPTANLVQHIIINDHSQGLNYRNYEINYNVPYKGVSKCDEYDKFDEKVGRDIAGSKADLKYHTAMMKKYSRISELLKKATEEIQVLEFEHMRKVMHINEDLQRYRYADSISNS